MPTASVTVIGNGVVTSYAGELAELIAESGYSFVNGPNLGSNSTWTQWWLRMLYIFDTAQADVCFKFDPDTMVDAMPTSIPAADYFGDVQVNSRRRLFVQGGITGLSRTAVRRLLASALLESRPDPNCWVPGVQSSFMDDQLISEVLCRLGILPVAWKECKSSWKVPIRNCPVRHAIVHPRYYY
jgi:hypothetical protein